MKSFYNDVSGYSPDAGELQEWVWVSQKHRNPRMRKIQVWVTYGWCYKYEAIPDICFKTETHRAIESATGNLVIKRK